MSLFGADANERLGLYWLRNRGDSSTDNGEKAKNVLMPAN